MPSTIKRILTISSIIFPLYFITMPSLAGSSVKLATPPASLAKWYKPENKRQVWLHTMFRLRREMQAIESYAQANNHKAMHKWSEKLSDDYRKISDMVPEWEDEIKPRLLPELQMFIDNGDSRRILATLDMIQRTCNDCHDTYQPLVTAIYRSPDYDDIPTRDFNGKDSSFEDDMETLSKSINQILIAIEDRQTATALQASKDLGLQLNALGDSCNQCHKKDPVPRERILGTGTQEKITSLQMTISRKQIKESRKLMGEIGVTVCARCHNTHRILGDLRGALID